MTGWEWFGLSMSLAFVYVVYRHVTRPLTPTGDELKELAMQEKKEEQQFDQLRNGSWTFVVEKGRNGLMQPTKASSIAPAILQDIRENQKMILDELKANTQASQELLAYLKQVFG